MKSILWSLVLLLWSTPQVSALVIAKEFEEIIRGADAIVVVQVRTVQQPIAEAPPYQVLKSEGLIPLKYRYDVTIEEVLKGDISEDAMDVSYYYRGHLKVSYFETGSGIELQLKPGNRYVILLKQMPDGCYEFIRAEAYDRKDEILRIYRKTRK